MRIAIVEDDEKAAAELKKFVERYSKEEKDACVVTCFLSGIDFISDYTPEWDLIFLDIKMPMINGVELARKLREIDEHVALIFTTSMGQYAVKGYEVDAMGFIVKPVEYYNFLFWMKKVKKRIHSNPVLLTVCAEEGKRSISVEDIDYIEVYNHTLLYHLRSMAVLTARGQLKSLEDRLSVHGFFRCNKFCLVNLKRVTAVTGTTVMVGKSEIQLSRRKYKDFVMQLSRIMGE